ncbi:MAG TPA: gfo/Idh/MocA family oxidoreductase, partial [Clostridia bacterium]|nr:gfo/Idh/MocA family oxidoreductase [Clostridia bacterium]
ENGALGSIVGTTAAFPGLSDRLSFHGTRGSILVESGRIVRWEVPDDPLDGAALDALNRVQMGNAHTPMALDIAPHRRQLEEIFACLKSGKPVAVDGAEARKAVALVLDIYRSAGTMPQLNR